MGRGVAERLHRVLPFKVGIIGHDIVDALPRADFPDGHAHPPNACLAPNDVRPPGYAIQPVHAVLLFGRVVIVS
jgi:hypothetical protein